MFFNPVQYDEPVFRPPAEANSAIVQATIGCSWNRCAFCEMYTSKKFRARPFEEVKQDIDLLSKASRGVKKVFLADGNAFVLSANRLIPIIQEINRCFGRLQRISSYALPKDILNKSESELRELQSLGLKLLYIGIETGDDTLLKLLNKGETFNSTVDGMLKAHACGIKTSVMVINGLGGVQHSSRHAEHSAQVINMTKPKYLSTLTLSFPYGKSHFQQRLGGTFMPLSLHGHLTELKAFISGIKVPDIIFRSDHVSNMLPLKGILCNDVEKITHQIEDTISQCPEDIYPSSPLVL